MKEQCENCWYYQRKYEQIELYEPDEDGKTHSERYAGEGECRRYPPRVVIRAPSEIMVGGPPVHGSEWCGEWANGEEKSSSRNRSYGAA